MSSIKMELEYPNFAGRIMRAEQEIKLFLAAMMQTNRGMLFDQSGAYNGHEKWAPLKFRQGMPLLDRGVLKQSIAPSSPTGRPGANGIVEFGTGVVTIGTNLLYAAMMNWGTTNLPGGVLRPVKAKALKIPVPGGKGATKGAKGLRKANGNFIFRKSVKIPARRYDDWNDEDKNELDESLCNKIVEVLSHD